MTAKPPPPQKKDRPKAVQLGLYFTDPLIKRSLDIVRKKWFMEGKISKPGYSEAVAYMARHFGELSKRPLAENGSLPLTSDERPRYRLLAETFKAVGWVQTGTDMEVLHAALKLLFKNFEDEAFLNEFLRSAGKV